MPTLSHNVLIDGRPCLDPASIIETRGSLGLPRFDSYALAERGLKPTFARILMYRKDAEEVFKDRSFSHTLRFSDSAGNVFDFKKLGLHYIESALDLYEDHDGAPVIVTLADERLRWGQLPVDKRYNVLHPILDGETYFASTLKTNGEEKRPWNWIEVLKNVWELTGQKPLAFSLSDLDVDPTTLEVNTEPDAQDRLWQQPQNLKLRGSLYGVLSWLAEYLAHEFCYDGETDIWNFIPFKTDDEPKWGPKSIKKIAEENADRFGSLHGQSISPKNSLFRYPLHHTPRYFAIRFPKSHYAFNAGQTDEDSELSYHTLYKYDERRIDNGVAHGADDRTQILYEILVSIYGVNGDQTEEERDKIERHAKKRAKLRLDEYKLTELLQRVRLYGLPSGQKAPVFNDRVLAMSVRNVVDFSTGKPVAVVLYEAIQGSNRLDDYKAFYLQYGKELVEFRKEHHEENFWEPNEELVGHHRAYVELIDDIASGKSGQAKVLMIEETGEDETLERKFKETSSLELTVWNVYPDASLAGLTKLWVVLSRQGKGWIPEQKQEGCGKRFNGVLQAVDPLKGFRMDAGDMVAAVRNMEFVNGILCECPPPEEGQEDVCHKEWRIALCPADCETSDGAGEHCQDCVSEREGWEELEGLDYLPEAVNIVKMTVTGMDREGRPSDGRALTEQVFYFYESGSMDGYECFRVVPQFEPGAWGGWYDWSEDFNLHPHPPGSPPTGTAGMGLANPRLGCVNKKFTKNFDEDHPLKDVGGWHLRNSTVGSGGIPLEYLPTNDPPFYGAYYAFFAIPLISEDPPIAENTFEAPNGVTYTLRVECAGAPFTGSTGGAACCDPMPAAGDLTIDYSVIDLTTGRETARSEGVAGDSEEYSSEDPIYTDPPLELTLFFVCENGSVRVWAEDQDDNVYELGNYPATSCDPFSISFAGEIPELNLAIGGRILEA